MLEFKTIFLLYFHLFLIFEFLKAEKVKCWSDKSISMLVFRPVKQFCYYFDGVLYDFISGIQVDSFS